MDARRDRPPGRLRRRAAVRRRRPGACRARAARQRRARPHGRRPSSSTGSSRTSTAPTSERRCTARSRSCCSTRPTATPDGVWLRTDDGELTFADAAGCGRRHRAAGCASTASARGDLVVLTARTTPPYLLALAGAHLAGRDRRADQPGVAPRAELAGLIDQTRPRAVVTDAELRRARSTYATRARRRRAGRSRRPSVPTGAAEPDDVAVLIPTSGTTGRSKLVMQTHRAYAMAGEGFPYWMELTADDRLMTSLPLFHVNAPGLLGARLARVRRRTGAAAALLRERLPRRGAPPRRDRVQRDRRDARDPDAPAGTRRRRRQPAAALLHRPVAGARAAGARSSGGSGCGSSCGYAMSETPVRPDLAARHPAVRHARHGPPAPDARRRQRGPGRRRRRPRRRRRARPASCCCAIRR